MGTSQLVALAAVLGWATGVRLYAAVFVVGARGALSWIDLPNGLMVLEQPACLVASGIMFLVEFLADKIPLVDSLWDLLHTVIRIPAGAALVAGSLRGIGGVDGGTTTAVAALLGGTLAAGAHVTKLTTRAFVNTSPEPFSNLGVSLLKDGMVVVGIWLAVTHPFWFNVALGLTVDCSAWLCIVSYTVLRGVVRRIRLFFGGRWPVLPVQNR